MVEENDVKYLMPGVRLILGPATDPAVSIVTPDNVMRETRVFIRLSKNDETITIHPDYLPPGTKLKTLFVPEIGAHEYNLIAFVSGYVPLIVAVETKEDKFVEVNGAGFVEHDTFENALEPAAP